MLILYFLTSLAFAGAEKKEGTIPPTSPQSTIIIPGQSTILVPGSEFGVRSTDTVKAINGHPVKDALEAADRLLREKDSVRKITVLRKGRTITLDKKMNGTSHSK